MPTIHYTLGKYEETVEKLKENSDLRRRLDAQTFCHPDQVSQGPGPHLAHNTSAVNFDVLFAGPKFRGDLLVHFPRDHEFEYCALPTGQAVQPVLNFK